MCSVEGDLYESEQVRKVPTGINGLDSVLHGGLPRGSLSLLSGGPGTGKTMLGMEFLVRGAQKGQPGIMLTFEEREEALRRYGTAIGWNIEELESAGMLSFISARLQPDAIISGSFDLRGIVSILESRIRTMKAQRVMIDAPDAFLRLLGDPARELSELRALNEWLLDSELTTVMTLKRQEQGMRQNEPGTWQDKKGRYWIQVFLEN